MRKLALLLLFASAALGQPTNININKIGNTQVPTGLVAADGILVKCPACPTSAGGGTTGTPADTFANPGAISEFLGFPMMWNGSSWDRVRGDATMGLWVNLKNASIAVTGTFWQGTQPVSGTITANAGTNLNTSALALDATLTNGGEKTQLVGGTTSTVTTIAASQLDTVLLSASTTRKAWNICNYSSDIMLVKFGATATQWSYTMRLQPWTCYAQNDVIYNGQIDAVWYPGFSGGQAMITELQP